jgi:hypothetical protein
MKHAHTDVLIAITQGKKVEYHIDYVTGGKWEEVDNFELVNPLSHPEHHWRIKPRSFKNEAWELFKDELGEDGKTPFLLGWAAVLEFQLSNGLIEEEDFELNNN